ncbi:MAG: MG2 domain-containing protein, partial [Armatimonadetes bacterium]|nr:MG2 domain-containing protein [Armatimonadota bacterium]
GLVAKHWGDEALAYVVDLETGRPVPGARVEFAAVRGPTVSGSTNEEGIFQDRLPGGDRPSLIVTRAEKDGSEAFVTERVWRTRGDSQDRVYLYTDRPVYRPGHRVLFKGIARRFANNAYSVPPQEPVEVEVRDSRDTLVYRGKLATNEFGSYHGEFELNDEVATGPYQVISTVAGRPHWSQFSVAEYRKPEYSVDVTPKKKRYTRGDRIQAGVSAQYYFGAPVAGAEVSYIVRRDQYWFYPFGREQGIPDDFESYGYGEVIDTGETRTDDAGLVRLSIPTKSVKRPSWAEPEQEAADYLYTVEVTVTDLSRKSVVGSATVLVTQGEFALSARPRRYIASPGDTAEIAIEAKDYDGKPVPGVKISVEAGPETWTGGESEVETEVKRQVTTDSKGEAVFSFKPRAQGYYRIQLQARDKRKNTIRASAFLWVTGETYADFGGVYPELEIVTDKDTYRKGETATLLINSQRKGATALLTVEGPRLYEHRLLELKGTSTRVDLPIRDDYAPNCFVSVS